MSGNDANDGFSWDTAKPTIQTAVDLCAANTLSQARLNDRSS